MQSGKSSLLVLAHIDAIRVHCVVLWARVDRRHRRDENRSPDSNLSGGKAPLVVSQWIPELRCSSPASLSPLRSCNAPNCNFQVVRTNVRFQSPVFRAEGWPCMARVCSVDAPIFSQGCSWEGAQLQSWWRNAAWPSTMSTRCAPDCKLYFPRPPSPPRTLTESGVVWWTGEWVVTVGAFSKLFLSPEVPLDAPS